MKIGVFDSGVGGITFLKQAKDILDSENFIYYADQKHAPYGTKTKEEVIRHVLNAVEYIANQNIKALVIACNTATSVASKELRARYDFPIIGMEPAVKPAVQIADDRRVLVLATELTIKEKKLDDLINRVNGKESVDLLAAPELVEFAEERIFERGILKDYLLSRLRHYNLNNYKSIVLGCTHFPFYKSYIEEIVPSHIQVIDGNIGTAKHLKRVLEREGLLNNRNEKGEIIYYSSSAENIEAPELKDYMEYLNEIEGTIKI